MNLPFSRFSRTCENPGTVMIMMETILYDTVNNVHRPLRIKDMNEHSIHISNFLYLPHWP